METKPPVPEPETNVVSLAEKKREAFTEASTVLLGKIDLFAEHATKKEPPTPQAVEAYIQKVQALSKEADALANTVSRNDYFGEEAYRLLAELVRVKLHALECALDVLHLSQNSAEARKIIAELFPTLLAEIDEAKAGGASAPPAEELLKKVA